MNWSKSLDKAANAHFENGKYEQALSRFEKALVLKRRTLRATIQMDSDEQTIEQQQPPPAKQTELSAAARVSAIPRPARQSRAVAKQQQDQQQQQIDLILAAVATAINNITYLFHRSGPATGDETMASYSKSLQIKRKILGPDHLFVGDTQQQYQLCLLPQEGIRTRSSSVRRCAPDHES